MSGYVRMGRGGAGNTISKEELKKKEEELRAQEEKAPRNGPTPGPEELEGYKHMGRGGAGNWFVPAELASGEVSDSSEAPTPEPPTEHASSVRPWRGRGGAGNFATGNPQNSESTQKAEAEKARIEAEKIKVSVDKTLQRPSQAHINDGERGAFHHDLGWQEAGL